MEARYLMLEEQEFVSLFNGNYKSKLQLDNMSNTEMMNQALRFTENNRHQVTCIVSPSATKEMDLSIIQNVCQLSLLREKLALFYILKDGLDVHKTHIPDLGLTLIDVSPYFDHLFQDYAITTYTGPENTRRELNNSCAIVIFSNKQEEIKLICEDVHQLIGEGPLPAIILATSSLLNPDHLENNILSVVSSAIQDKHEAMEFWLQIKNNIDNAVVYSKKFKPEDKQRCVMM